MSIMKTVDEVCRSESIQYSLCGGSVIGAHLYNGFIPWDDDIDLMMTRENYEKFLKVFSRNQIANYRIMNYRYVGKGAVPTLFTRIEDINTVTIEKIAGKVREGHVFIDITVMDNVKSKFSHRLALVYGSYVYTQLYRQNGMVPGTRWKKALYKLISCNLSPQSTLQLYAKYDQYCSRRKGEKTDYCAELLSAAYSGILYDRRLFDGYRDIEFEGEQLMIIERYQDYLFARYGKREFQKEVAPEKRINSHISSLNFVP